MAFRQISTDGYRVQSRNMGMERDGEYGEARGKVLKVGARLRLGTPGYMVMEEILRDKLRGRAERRTWAYERRLEEGKGSVLARKCLEEIRERGLSGKVNTGWEEERREFFEHRGWNLEKIDKEGKEEILAAVFSKEGQL